MTAWLTVADARSLYAEGDAAHDFDHVLRVTHLAMQIAAAEGADVAVVRLAALLHDLPPTVAAAPDHRTTHHLQAAAAAQQLLAARGAAAALIAQVAHCIEAHRFRDQRIQPQTLEAQCLYDADKLDAIGAIGVARAFAYAGAHGSRLWVKPVTAIMDDSAKAETDYTPVHEYVFKLRHLAATLHTATARALARERHATMVAFFQQLDAEMTASGSVQSI
ncbi:MAG TPA: hypothetical protein DCL15_10255 [Chloroflexi bacterium]|nr:hypothetical protein [Chloroflexota bacterium]HHW85250.1 HD domain-containing protein [Chloroflexota bacterium]